jgi:hypothetical protein
MPRSNARTKKRVELKDNDKEVDTNVHSTLDDNTLGYTDMGVKNCHVGSDIRTSFTIKQTILFINLVA